MKKTRHLLALLMIIVFSFTFLTGCGSKDEEATTEEPSSTSEEITQEDIMGVVDEIDGSKLNLKVCTPDKAINSYMNLDGVTLTMTKRTETINIDNNTKIKYVTGGQLLPGTLEDNIAEGDLVAVDYTGDTQKVIVLEYDGTIEGSDATTSDDDEEDNSSTSSSSNKNPSHSSSDRDDEDKSNTPSNSGNNNGTNNNNNNNNGGTTPSEPSITYPDTNNGGGSNNGGTDNGGGTNTDPVTPTPTPTPDPGTGGGNNGGNTAVVE